MAQDLSLVKMINRITSMPAHPAAKNKAELDSNTNGVTCLHNTIRMHYFSIKLMLKAFY